MSKTLAFLDLILPDEGLRCCFIAQHKTNYFFQTNDELCAFMLNMDAQGYTVYHACSTYKTDANRKQINVARIASLWGDVDAGPGKAYPDTMAAVNAVVNACKREKLPVPLFVGSGRGLHIYWPLAISLLPQDWLPYAKGLRAVLHRAGLRFDPARSCDSASILRSPGTHHRKEKTPLPVTMGPEVPYYGLELFAHLLGVADVKPGPEFNFEAPTWLRDRHAPDFVRSGLSSGLPRYVDSYAARIAEECAQVRSLRDSHGNIREPLWFACLGVLAFASDGGQFAHEWSSGFDGYSEEETDEKLDRKRELSGATTCEYFHGENPGPCEACPHWQKITSPIALGIQRDQSEEPKIREAATALTLPKLPRSFTWGRSNELLFTTESNHQPIEHLISTYPIFICDANEDETSRDHSLTFKAWLPAKDWFVATVSQKTLMQPGGINELDRFGINIHDSERFKKYIRDALDMYYQEGKLKIRYEQYGWKDSETAFLFGRKLYTKQGEIDVVQSNELQIRNQWLGAGVNADKNNPEAYGLERWSQAASKLFVKRCEPQAIAVLASFASPLMRFLAVDEGGAILSLVTQITAKGKTTALTGAFSVWGDKKGLSLTVDDNRVTKFLTMAALGNLPVVHDELQMRDPNTLRDFVITFTNGRDKMRATRHGEIRHTKNDWQTLLISASNVSLVEILEGVSAVDAPAFRILEMPCDVPKEYDLGEKLKKEMIANAGYAGEVYSRFLVNNVDMIRKGVEQYTEHLWKQTQLDVAYRFWIRAAACILMAGVIVRHLKLLDFSLDYVMGWLINFMKDTARVKTKSVKSGNWPVEALGDFCMKEMQKFIIVAQTWYPNKPNIKMIREVKGEVIGCYAIAERRLTVTLNALRAYARKNEIVFRDWYAQLEEAKIVSGVDRRTITAGTELPSMPVVCTHIDMTCPDLAEIDVKIVGIKPDADPTNITPFRR